MIPRKTELRVVRVVDRPFRSVAALAVSLSVLGISLARSLGSDQAATGREPPRAERTNKLSDQSPPRYLLQYKFPTKLLARYEVEHKSTIAIRYNDVQQTTYNEAQTRKHYRVVEQVKDGIAVLEPTIEHVAMLARADDEAPVRFDSHVAQDDCSPQFRNVLKMVGRPLARMQFASSGALLSVQEIDNAGKTGSQVRADKVTASQNFLVTFPEHPLAVGDSWSQDFTVQVSEAGNRLTRPVTLRREYCLDAVDGPLATITFKTAVITPIHDPAIQAQLIQSKPAGTIVFDMDRGLIVSREAKLDEVVIVPFGPKTSMHAVSRRTERLVTDGSSGRGDDASR